MSKFINPGNITHEDEVVSKVERQRHERKSSRHRKNRQNVT